MRFARVNGQAGDCTHVMTQGVRTAHLRAGNSRINATITRNSARIYHVPGQQASAKTRADASRGERWLGGDADSPLRPPAPPAFAPGRARLAATLPVNHRAGPVPAYGCPSERRSPPPGLTLRDRALHVNPSSSNAHASANAGSCPSDGHRISRADRSSPALDLMSSAECRPESMCPALRADRTPFGRVSETSDPRR